MRASGLGRSGFLCPSRVHACAALAVERFLEGVAFSGQLDRSANRDGGPIVDKALEMEFSVLQ